MEVDDATPIRHPIAGSPVLLFCAIAPPLVAQTQSRSAAKGWANPAPAPGILRLCPGQDQPLEYRLWRRDGRGRRDSCQPHHRRSLLLVERCDTRAARLLRQGSSISSGVPRQRRRSSPLPSSRNSGTAASATRSRLCAVPSNSTNSLNCKIRRPSGYYPPGQRHQNRNRKPPKASRRASVKSDIRVHRLQVPRQRVRPRPRAQPNRQQWVTRMMVRRACNRATCCCNAGWRRSKTARITSNKD